MLATAAAGLPPDAAEFVAEPHFTLLQRRMRASWPGAGLLAAVPVTLIVFDVLRSGSDQLTGSPYVLRRALLEDLGLEIQVTVQVPPAFPGDAAALLDATREQGLEGIVLKRPASLYHPGRRTREWVKIRNIRAADVRVGGWLPGTGARGRAVQDRAVQSFCLAATEQLRPDRQASESVVNSTLSDHGSHGERAHSRRYDRRPSYRGVQPARCRTG
jgi:bifunctional non-homologous end joining protein LigD